jgi:hypothetical protein
MALVRGIEIAMVDGEIDKLIYCSERLFSRVVRQRFVTMSPLSSTLNV